MAEAGPELLLYGYWRSSSAYRVRIALNLKGLAYRQQAVHLVRDGGEQHSEAYRRLNPMGLVPALVHGERVIVESLAMCEYLEELFPQPALLPADPAGRARVRSLALSIACGVQPMNNLAVLNFIRERLGADDEGVRDWYGQWVARGFAAFEQWLKPGGLSCGQSGAFCHGDSAGLADCFLVPQVYNAERFGCDLGPYPRIREITARCRALDAFIDAAPENQPDAPPAG